MQSPKAVAALMDDDKKLSPESEKGQDLLEYALLCALIALVAFGAVASVGNTIYNVFWKAIGAASF